MNPAIYAVVDGDGFVTALVNAQLLPEIVDREDAIPAPYPDPFPEPGQVWRVVAGEWQQMLDPRLQPATTAFTKKEE